MHMPRNDTVDLCASRIDVFADSSENVLAFAGREKGKVGRELNVDQDIFSLFSLTRCPKRNSKKFSSVVEAKAEVEDTRKE